MPEMSVAVMTVIGPVGPLICDGVPPNREAKNPTIMAPTRPAKAPMAPMLGMSCTSITPKAWIPKAKAKGRATMPAVMPPKMSPFKLLVLSLFIVRLLFSKELAMEHLLLQS